MRNFIKFLGLWFGITLGICSLLFLIYLILAFTIWDWNIPETTEVTIIGLGRLSIILALFFTLMIYKDIKTRWP